MKCLPYFLSLGVLRHAVQFVWQPRRDIHENYKNQIEKPPYDRLCVSAVLSRLAYLPKKDFHFSSIELIKTNNNLKTLLQESLVENTEEIEMINARDFSDFHDTQVYVWKANNTVFVVFRGTESKDDWLDNLDLRRKNIGFGKDILVHNGFRNQFLTIEEKLTDFFDRNKGRFDNVYFIGHSLGMSCATIASIFYIQYFEKNFEVIPEIHCHSFGGPRVGNIHFANLYMEKKELMKNTWRIVDYKDPVPRVPISNRFVHIPCHTIRLGEHKNVEYVYEDTKWFLRPFHSFFFIDFLNPIAPHDIKNYIIKLRDIANDVKK